MNSFKTIKSVVELRARANRAMRLSRRNGFAVKGLGREKRETYISVIINAIISAIATGGLVLWFAYFQNDRIASDAAFVSVVQSRVATCFELAAHHRIQHEKDLEEERRRGSPIPPVLLLIRNEVDGSTTEEYQSTNQQRQYTSVLMGRELGQCLARYQQSPSNTEEGSHMEEGSQSRENPMDQLRTCVHSATFDQPGKQVFDLIEIDPDTGDNIGRSNPAC